MDRAELVTRGAVSLLVSHLGSNASFVLVCILGGMTPDTLFIGLEALHVSVRSKG